MKPLVGEGEGFETLTSLVFWNIDYECWPIRILALLDNAKNLLKRGLETLLALPMLRSG